MKKYLLAVRSKVTNEVDIFSFDTEQEMEAFAAGYDEKYYQLARGL